MHMQPIIKKLKLVSKKEKFPVSEEIYHKGLYLPSGIGNTIPELNKVVNAIKLFIK